MNDYICVIDGVLNVRYNGVWQELKSQHYPDEYDYMMKRSEDVETLSEDTYTGKIEFKAPLLYVYNGDEWVCVSPEPPAIYRLLLRDLCGDDHDMIMHWWHSGNKAFDGISPFEYHNAGGDDEMLVARYVVGMINH